MRRALLLLAQLFLPAALYAGASRDCVQAESDRITLSAAGFSAAAGTFAVWAAVDPMSADGTVVTIRVNNQNFIEVSWADIPDRINMLYRAGNVTEENLLPAINEDGVWRHYVISWSVAADTVNYWVNGVADTPDGTLGTWSGTPTITICSRNTGTISLDGRVAHFELWDRALTDVEVAEDYHCPGSVVSGLVNWLPLWEDGDTYVDLSAAGQNATNTGTTASSSGPPVSLCGGQS